MRHQAQLRGLPPREALEGAIPPVANSSKRKFWHTQTYIEYSCIVKHAVFAACFSGPLLPASVNMADTFSAALKAIEAKQVVSKPLHILPAWLPDTNK